MGKGFKKAGPPRPSPKKSIQSRSMFNVPPTIKFIIDAEESLRVKGNVFKKCPDATRLTFEYTPGCPFGAHSLKKESKDITVTPANGLKDIAVDMFCETCSSLVHILWGVEEEPDDHPTIEEVLDEEDGEVSPPKSPEPIDPAWKRVVAQKISNVMVNVELQNSRFVTVQGGQGGQGDQSGRNPFE